ncbi:MAG: hypothetical protein AAFU85_29845 [Planctomycetota bacterium]
MIKLPSHSASVELFLNIAGQRYELGHLGPDFALLGKEQLLPRAEAEIETIIDHKVTRWPIRITSELTGDSKRFSFEAV